MPQSTRNKLSRAGSKSTWGNDGDSQLALKLGYDAIEGGAANNLVVLNRKILVVDKTNYNLYTKKEKAQGKVDNVPKQASGNHSYTGPNNKLN